MVEVLVNSIQQPEEEFLGVMLGVPLELKGALGHHILQQKPAGQTNLRFKFTSQKTEMIL